MALLERHQTNKPWQTDCVQWNGQVYRIASIFLWRLWISGQLQSYLSQDQQACPSKEGKLVFDPNHFFRKQNFHSQTTFRAPRYFYIKSDQYQATSKKDEILLQNNYLVKGTVVNYTGKIKLYHKDYGMIVHDNYLAEIPIQ